jgi:hypothetical protein
MKTREWELAAEGEAMQAQPTEATEGSRRSGWNWASADFATGCSAVQLPITGRGRRICSEVKRDGHGGFGGDHGQGTRLDATHSVDDALAQRYSGVVKKHREVRAEDHAVAVRETESLEGEGEGLEREERAVRELVSVRDVQRAEHAQLAHATEVAVLQRVPRDHQPPQSRHSGGDAAHDGVDPERFCAAASRLDQCGGLAAAGGVVRVP